MADTEDTPPADTPKPRARRAPRKTSPAKPATASSAGTPTASAPKPRRKPAAAAASDTASTTKKTAVAPPKPRSSKRATPAPKRPTRPKAAATPEKSAGWKNKAAIAGGLAAVGAAATAALLSLRGSTPRSTAAGKDGGKAKPVDNTADHAHTPDGTDATKSFNAGIADENTIPE
ncbi:hypothetical protein [Sphingomonas sp. TZW2008]|uniref:hypothetical protein n=1 Tax=Sphingomonas sp. TZW2008 TaxID=1917973 RepID=UPI000A26B239|nr:hypothetical protein [Sphingomonas sp. TZW2008]